MPATRSSTASRAVRNSTQTAGSSRAQPAQHLEAVDVRQHRRRARPRPAETRRPGRTAVGAVAARCAPASPRSVSMPDQHLGQVGLVVDDEHPQRRAVGVAAAPSRSSMRHAHQSSASTLCGLPLRLLSAIVPLASRLSPAQCTGSRDEFEKFVATMLDRMTATRRTGPRRPRATAPAAAGRRSRPTVALAADRRSAPSRSSRSVVARHPDRQRLRRLADQRRPDHRPAGRLRDRRAARADGARARRSSAASAPTGWPAGTRWAAATRSAWPSRTPC